MIDALVTAAQALIDSVAEDNNRHGGLTSRDTIRNSDECRTVINRIQRLKKLASSLDKPKPTKERKMTNTVSTFDRFIATVKDASGAGKALWINPDNIVYLTANPDNATANARMTDGSTHLIMVGEGLRLVQGE